MSQTIPLWQPFATVTLDGSGSGTAKIGPARPREHWQVTSANISVATNTLEAICTVYMGTVAGPQTLIDTSFQGSSGDACGINQDMQTGMLIFAKWVGGDPGSVATVIVNGTYSIGAPG